MGTSEVLSRLRAFVAERDWQQFHSPENLAKSISIESGELLECFQWSGAADASALEEELADVLTYCYLLADKIGKSPDDLILQKLTKTIEKYPLEKARGTSVKYDRL
jgi:dCTP diphosphatase